MQVLKFYKKCLEKKFSNLSIKVSISKIIELLVKNLFSIKINLLATTIIMKDFIEPSRLNYACITSNQSKFVLPDLFITINLSKCEKALCFLYKDKKALYDSFYEYKWFLDSSTFCHKLYSAYISTTSRPIFTN